MPHQYYNPVSAMGDPRRGHGYGKSQDKLPSHSTGIGSTYTMGWETGIYPPELEDVEEIDIPFDSLEDLRTFFTKVNLGYRSSDSVRPRADTSSYANSNNRFSTVGMGQMTEQNIPMIKGMVPIPTSVKYPNGLGMATGGSSSEFGSTRIGPGKVGGDGSQFGYSRKPFPFHDEDDDFRFFSLVDLLSLGPDERNFLKQQRKLKRSLTIIESLSL